MIIAIDPGPVESAYVDWDGSRIVSFGKFSNESLLMRLSYAGTYYSAYDICVIEMIASYGMPVGYEVFETCVWIGRFMQAFGAAKCERLTRNQVKNHMCHSSKAKDSNIRQAIIDRFGGSKAIGLKKSPGPLYGISGDVWAALAVALTYEGMR